MDEDAYSYTVNSTTTETSEDAMDYERKKYDLIENFKKVVGRECDGKRCKTLAIIGTEGAGKSSLINSIAAAFTNRNWRQYAFPGHFSDSSQVTMYIESFPKDNYCTDDEDLIGYCLPTLIDMAGFQGTPCKITEEILRLVFYGRIPDFASLIDIREYAAKNGIPKLRERFLLEKDGLKVDAVVFVASAYQLQQEGIPFGLISNVRKAARPTGGSGFNGRRVIPVFGVMTNIDKVNVLDPSFTSRELEFKKSLGLDATRYLRCENYCDEVENKYRFQRTDHVLAKLDVPMLNFLKMVCDPVIVVLNAEESYDTAVMSGMDATEKATVFLKKQQKYKEQEMKNFWFTNSTAIMYAIKFVFVFILMYIITFFTSTVNSSFSRELIATCAEHRYSSANAHGEKIPYSYLTKFCNYGSDGNDFIFTYRYCFWYSLTVTAVFVGFDIVFPDICKRLLEHVQRMQQFN